MNNNSKIKSNFIFFLLIPILVIIDQIIKINIKAGFDVGQSKEIIKGFFSITYIQNTGAAFGILKDQRIIFIAMTIAIIAALLFQLLKYNNFLLKLCIVLIISGAIGNLIDRLRYGYVVDMFDFHGIWNYIFNFADILVVVGVISFCLLIFLGKDS